MHRVVLLLLWVLLAVPVTASAQGPDVAPPGLSGVEEYLETVPSADGDRPSGGLAPSLDDERTDNRAKDVLPARTYDRLAAGSADSRRVAALAGANSPVGAERLRGGSAAERRSLEVDAVKRLRGRASETPAASVRDVLTGSSAGSAGAIIPALLGLTAAVGVAVLFVRRRSQ